MWLQQKISERISSVLPLPAAGAPFALLKGGAKLAGSALGARTPGGSAAPSAPDNLAEQWIDFLLQQALAADAAAGLDDAAANAETPGSGLQGSRQWATPAASAAQQPSWPGADREAASSAAAPVQATQPNGAPSSGFATPSPIPQAELDSFAMRMQALASSSQPQAPVPSSSALTYTTPTSGYNVTAATPTSSSPAPFMLGSSGLLQGLGSGLQRPASLSSLTGLSTATPSEPRHTPTSSSDMHAPSDNGR